MRPRWVKCLARLAAAGWASSHRFATRPGFLLAGPRFLLELGFTENAPEARSFRWPRFERRRYRAEANQRTDVSSIMLLLFPASSGKRLFGQLVVLILPLLQIGLPASGFPQFDVVADAH